MHYIHSEWSDSKNITVGLTSSTGLDMSMRSLTVSSKVELGQLTA